jgi:VWFA-related protein
MRVSSRSLFVCYCFLSISCLSGLGFAQQTTPPAQPPQLADRPATPERTEGRRIEIDVVVTNKSGAPVSGLQQQDFTLLDDKQPQKIQSFLAFDESTAAATPPQQVILLVDAVNISYTNLGMERLQLAKFLQQNGGQLPLPTSFVFLADTSAEIQHTATRDGNALANLLNSNQAGLRISNRSQGVYGAADRLQISLRALEELIAYESKQPGRKLVIWISPGWAFLTGPNIDLTAKQQAYLFDTVVRLSHEMREARLTLYSIDPLGLSDAGSLHTFYYQSFLKGVSAAKRVEYGDLALQVLAAQSGGRVLNSSNDIDPLVASCLTDAKAFYTVAFDAPRADHPNEYHSLEVKIDRPGVTARTRLGYYAQP